MLVRIIFPEAKLTSDCLIFRQQPALMKEIQQLLQTKKFYHGQITGLCDAETLSAITQFQEREGLRIGTVTALTLCRLLPAVTQSIAPQTQTRRAKGPSSPAHILIQKGPRQLTLFNGKTPIRTYPVAIGKPSTPTPTGNYAIASKVLNPGGMLGSRWMGLNFDTYGIHGTSKP
ncbi:peptidoglycan hydrolase-like protein with peptidoglycan-binding domain [Sporomusaceae bacterium BoRhaA]|jgi:peptidoglycan hydrolase-like protein with peptidoglycan-binding domain|uniref:L,D-transpeptidase family protein n=1 Tax=Pelorhabdus rhamnosifermentans TaxID=2772457 RepID=UPI001FE4B678|nr:L,D-transpeptidase family protein [Pelorhabdus rhamnosifermentans]MBU2702131.1 peptidoglycan hydrolase-like protein with peptidoglycan-binding domain [Pelorhabdus rhamnosifermentans]